MKDSKLFLFIRTEVIFQRRTQYSTLRPANPTKHVMKTWMTYAILDWTYGSREMSLTNEASAVRHHQSVALQNQQVASELH